jgi:hypothetical protein
MKTRGKTPVSRPRPKTGTGSGISLDVESRFPVQHSKHPNPLRSTSMRARLRFDRLPPLLFPLIFALVAAMVLGGTLGYVLKPSTLVPGRTQVLVIHDAADSSPGSGACISTHRNRAC